VVRVEQGFQGGVGKQVYPVLAAAAAVLVLFVLAVGARVGLMLVLPLVPMALLFVWIGPRLAPTGPVAIKVGRDRICLVEADGTH